MYARDADWVPREDCSAGRRKRNGESSEMELGNKNRKCVWQGKGLQEQISDGWQ